MIKELQTAIEEDRLVLFVGAGMSMNLGFPNWNTLIKGILEKLFEKHGGNTPMNFPFFIKALEDGSKTVFETLDEIERQGYKQEAKGILYKIISEVDFTSGDLTKHKKLWQISDKIITTNYDKVIDSVVPHGITVFSNENKFQQVESIKGKPFLYKIHGDITNPDTCVLFSSDYEDLYKGDKSNTNTLRNFLQNKTLLFLGFSLEDPFITSQIEYLSDLYNGYANTHVIVMKGNKDFSKFRVNTYPIEDYQDSFITFLDELIEIKQKLTTKTGSGTNEIKSDDLDISKTDDIVLLRGIFDTKVNELKKNIYGGDEQRKIEKEIVKLRQRIMELQTKELDIFAQIPHLKEPALENLFETITASQKLSPQIKAEINQIKDQHNSDYKWYHRSVIVSALACSVINHKDLDPAKLDLLIDFAYDENEKVWKKAITYIFLLLNHLGNKWLRFGPIKSRLVRLKEHNEIQDALKSIIQIMQFELHSRSSISEKIFENEYFKDNPFNYFMPFYEDNPSIDKLYEKDGIEDVEKFKDTLLKLPIPDPIKYLICNSPIDKSKLDRENSDFENQREKVEIMFRTYLGFMSHFEPFMSYINDFISFYKIKHIDEHQFNDKLNIISVKNINEHLLNTVEKHRTLARQFMQQKDWGTAITNLNALLKIKPEDIEALLDLAQCQDNTDKGIEEKLKIRKQIESYMPNNADNLFHIGNIYYEKKNFEEALHYINRAIELDSTDEDYFNLRAAIKIELGKYEEAIEDYNKAIELNPKEGGLFCNRGVAKANLNKYEEAIEDYNKAIELNPKEGLYFYNSGISKANLNRYVEAIEDYNKAIELNPKEGDYIYHRGELEAELGNYKEAIEDYTKAIDIYNKSIELNPKEGDYFHGKANALRQLRRYSEAHNFIDKAIELNPEKGIYWGTKASIYSSENKEDEFYKYLEIAFTKKAKAKWLNKDIKEKYKNEPRFQELLKKYNQSLE